MWALNDCNDQNTHSIAFFLNQTYLVPHKTFFETRKQVRPKRSRTKKLKTASQHGSHKTATSNKTKHCRGRIEKKVRRAHKGYKSSWLRIRVAVAFWTEIFSLHSAGVAGRRALFVHDSGAGVPAHIFVIIFVVNWNNRLYFMYLYKYIIWIRVNC